LDDAVRDKAEDVGNGNKRHCDVCQVVINPLRETFEVEMWVPDHYPQTQASNVNGASYRHLNPERPGFHGKRLYVRLHWTGETA
jgi:hypothetical protein